MDKNYFVIRNCGGDTFIEEMSRELLLKRINEDYYGDKFNFFTKLVNHDTNYWNDGILIIKGSIVTPIAEKVVTEYTID